MVGGATNNYGKSNDYSKIKPEGTFSTFNNVDLQNSMPKVKITKMDETMYMKDPKDPNDPNSTMKSKISDITGQD